MAESEVVAVIGESAAEEAAQEESPEELTGGCADVQCNGIHRLINLLDALIRKSALRRAEP